MWLSKAINVFSDMSTGLRNFTIHHSVPVYEVNRHGRLRKVGEMDRPPLYNATDWNYIRFNCGCMSYELNNDNLRPYLY